MEKNLTIHASKRSAGIRHEKNIENTFKSIRLDFAPKGMASGTRKKTMQKKALGFGEGCHVLRFGLCVFFWDFVLVGDGDKTKRNFGVFLLEGFQAYTP